MWEVSLKDEPGIHPVVPVRCSRIMDPKAFDYEYTCNAHHEHEMEGNMARYSKGAQKTVKQAMQKRKKGTLKSGSGKKVKSRKQAIAIGLSEARKKGKKVPAKKL